MAELGQQQPSAPSQHNKPFASSVTEFRSMLQRQNSSFRNLQQFLQNNAPQDGLSNCFHRSEKGPDEVIFELFKIPHKPEASIGKLITVLKSYGLQPRVDPRLQPMMERLWAIERESEELEKEAKDPKHWKLSRDDFCKCISESLTLITRTLQNNLVVPSWGYFCGIIKEIYEMCIPIREGQLASYIPQLSRQDPTRWGLAICTIDGQRFAMGDSRQLFCLQSVSKAFNYAIAASELGADVVHQYVGQEPSGRLFNEICLDAKNRPHNPMVNSGAIIVTSLIQNKMNIADRFDYILQEYRKIAGDQYVGFNNAVFLSERMTSDRNCALAYYMKEYKCFPPETTSLQEALDFYFQLCSLEAKYLIPSAQVMAATLANGGVCPLTEERCVQSRPCRDVLSLMYSCGMYDYSGQFAFHVGLPAKSGVSGAMIVVVPNLCGICLWSPALDTMGNSCRGVAFCKEMVKRFNFHNYDSLAHTESSKFDPRKRFGEFERDQVVSLLFAAKAGDLNTIRRLCIQGGDLELCDYDKRTALHLAASEGHIELVKFLLNVGHVKVEPRDRWNRTPRDDAETFGYTAIVQLLEKARQKKKMGQVLTDIRDHKWRLGESDDDKQDDEKELATQDIPEQAASRTSSISSEEEEEDEEEEDVGGKGEGEEARRERRDTFPGQLHQMMPQGRRPDSKVSSGINEARRNDAGGADEANTSSSNGATAGGESDSSAETPNKFSGGKRSAGGKKRGPHGTPI